jgi:hypothetical protein
MTLDIFIKDARTVALAVRIFLRAPCMVYVPTTCIINSPVFQIHDILRRRRILGSVHWITDPDPALFVSAFQDADKK